MKVLQLIDSLQPGGAERLVVNLANGLLHKVDGSFLCVTRMEGPLIIEIDPKVQYHYLRKRNSLDFRAIFRLSKFVNKHKIDIIHAHTTSYFLGTLIKLLNPKLKLIWHEHQGNRILSKRRNNLALYFCSFLFERILVVTKEQEEWCINKLGCKKVYYLPNFIKVDALNSPPSRRAKIVICVANLKIPKNHLNLIKAFKKSHKAFPDWKLQLVGKDFLDEYSQAIKRYIKEEELDQAIELLGSRNDITFLLENAAIGVLASDIEGLPMAILEYGAHGLAVIGTDVGEVARVLGNFGQLIPPNNVEELSKAMNFYMAHPEKAQLDAERYRDHIKKNYSFQAILPQIKEMYTS